METLRADSVPESPGTRRFVEDSTTAADGVGGGERLTTMTGDLTEMPGEVARAAESSKAEAKAARAMLESGAQRLAALEEQAARPKIPQGVVGHSVWPLSP